jgi:hypothetical protein
MMTNVGVIDRALRLIVGLGLLGWSWGYYGPPLPAWAAWSITILGVYPAVTGLLRWCPALAFAGVSTCAEEG